MALEGVISTLKIESGIDAGPSFHPFPRLPMELRLKIWQLAVKALPGRVIPISEISTDTDEPGETGKYEYTSTRPHPRLAVVSHEARIAVFENLESLFRPELSYIHVTICMEKDTLLWDAISSTAKHMFGYKRLADAIGTARCQKITKFAIEDPCFAFFGRLPVVLMISVSETNLQNMFPNLETLACVRAKKLRKFGHDSAKYHIGELELVPAREELRLAARLRLAELKIKLEYFRLGLVGGHKIPTWDAARNHYYWRLPNAGEREKTAAISQARRLNALNREQEQSMMWEEMRLESLLGFEDEE